MASDSMLSSPTTVAFARELAGIRRDLDAVRNGQTSTQMDYSSIMGPLYVRDPVTGDLMGTIGTQPDGGVATIPVGGPPPPALSTPILTPGIHTVTVEWDGNFALGVARPTNFAFGAVHASQVGANFITDPSNLVATLTEAGTVPIGPYEGPVWVRFVGYNTSTPPVTGPASATVTVTPDQVVAQSVLDGIITETKLADQAVAANKVKLGAIGTGQLAGLAVTSDQLAANSVVAGKVAADTISANELLANSVGAAEIVAGAVQAGKIAADAVTANEILAGAVTAGKIAANAITAGTIAAGAVTATKLEATLAVVTRLYAGTLTGTRAEINSTGFEAWQGSLQTFDVDAATGNVTMLGTYRSAAAGQSRVEIMRDGTLDFYTGATLTGRIEDSVGGMVFRGAGATASSMTGRMFLDSGAASITYGNTTGSQPGTFRVDGAGTQQWGRLVGLRFMKSYAGDGTEPRIFMLATDSSGVDIGSTVCHYVELQNTGTRSMFSNPGTNNAVAFGNGEIWITSGNGLSFSGIAASYFAVNSSVNLKEDVAEVVVPADRTSWDVIEGAPAQQWHYKSERPGVRGDRPTDANGRGIKIRGARRTHADGSPDMGDTDDSFEMIDLEYSDEEPVRRNHRFPVADDLRLLDPDLVTEKQFAGQTIYSVDLRDVTGVLWDAVDMLIKRTRLLEDVIARRLPGLDLPARPQRGDVTSGVGEIAAGRTRRVLDPDTGQIVGR